MTSAEHSRNLVMAVFCLNKPPDECSTYISTQEVTYVSLAPKAAKLPVMDPNILWGKIIAKRLCDTFMLVFLGI